MPAIAGFSFFASGGGGTGWHQTGIAYNFGLANTDIVKLVDGKYVAGWGNQAVLNSLNYMKQLRWTDDVLPRENLGWDTNAQALATGNAAMIMMAGDQFNWMHTTFPDADINKFGFAPMPVKNAGDKSVSLAGGNIAMVSATATADEQEAALWWRLFTQFDVTEIMRSVQQCQERSDRHRRRAEPAAVRRRLSGKVGRTAGAVRQPPDRQLRSLHGWHHLGLDHRFAGTAGRRSGLLRRAGHRRQHDPG